MSFVHLHVHSEYSLLDSASRLKDLVKRAKGYEMPAIALTDHGVMYGAVNFFNACKGTDVKAIIGCELYLTKDRFDRHSRDANATHLVCLCKDLTGYQNLVKLVSRGFSEGFHHKPRVDKQLLEQHLEGLVVLSGCHEGEICQLLLQNRDDEAEQVAAWYRDRCDFYLEICDHGEDRDKTLRPKLVALARKLDIPLVATNDSHYTAPEDRMAHDVLRCIELGKSFNDPSRPQEYTAHHYLKSPEEMRAIFADLPEACDNTLVIAEKCQFKFKFGEYKIPVFPGLGDKTPEQYLEDLSWLGLKERYGEVTPALEERLKIELETINTMGFAAYFLIVWEYIKWGRENGIAVGPGRGSAAGSIIAYCLGITNLDPLPYNLLFERFLNPERVSMPDIDTDFCIERRGEVINHAIDLYGSPKVSMIVTFGTLGAKAVLKDVGKALGFSFQDTDRLTKMIPPGVGVSLADALEDGQELKRAVDTDPQVARLVELAKKLEGLARHTSIHAAGVVIAKDNLEEVVPIQISPDGQVVAQYEMGDLEKLGLLKMDFLGLRNLTMIVKALDLIKKTRGIELDIDSLTFDDPEVYKLLRKGDVIGVFQLESSGMRKLVANLAPNVFEEIIALLALYRPGPLGSGMVEDFVERKHGRRPVTFPHKDLESILKDTYGLIVYQEQIMQIAQIMGGYSLGGADLLRRAMGKKNLEEMAKQRSTFMAGAAAKGIDEALADNLFSTMEKFAEYGFNKSHSAAYALVTYHTAYLKAHFPAEYMAALLSSVMSIQDKIMLYTADARQSGITVLPPDINASELDFGVQDGAIRFGLGAIKGLGEGAIQAIVEERDANGPFASLFDFCVRVDLKLLNRRTLEAVIKTGAFDSLCGNRRQLVEGLEATLEAASFRQNEADIGQTSLFALMGDASEVTTPHSEPTLPDVPPFNRDEELAFEKELLGLYVSGHPLDSSSELVRLFASHTIADINEAEEPPSNRRDGEEAPKFWARELPGEVMVGVWVSSVKKMFTKKNEPMAALAIEDPTGSLEAMCFPEAYERCGELLQANSKLFIRGKIQLREEGNKLLVSQVLPLEMMQVLKLQVPDGFKLPQFVKLREVLLESSGATPVALRFNGGRNATVVVGKEFWVEPSDGLLAELRHAFGEEQVALTAGL